MSFFIYELLINQVSFLQRIPQYKRQLFHYGTYKFSIQVIDINIDLCEIRFISAFNGGSAIVKGRAPIIANNCRQSRERPDLLGKVNV